MISSTRRALAVSVFALTAVMGTAASAADQSITLKEACTAQRAWGDALVAISLAFDNSGFDKAKATAEKAIDTAYGYNLGPVLFKPTLTADPQTFRLTRRGALAYFVGRDSDYPNDKGFALNHWRSVEVRNVGVQINGALANTMGKVLFRDKDGQLTTVDKTWVFKKDDAGVVRIIVHHSSLPLPAEPSTAPIYDPKTDPCTAALAG
jgi:hypothetical protein